MTFALDRSGLKACLLALGSSFQGVPCDKIVVENALRIQREEVELWLSNLDEAPAALNRGRLLAGIRTCEMFLADAIATLPSLEIVEPEKLLAQAKSQTFADREDLPADLELTKRMREATIAASVFRWALTSLNFGD